MVLVVFTMSDNISVEANVYIAVAVILLLVGIVILVGCCVLKRNQRMSRIELACSRRLFESSRKYPAEPRYVFTKFGGIDGAHDTYDHLRAGGIDIPSQNVNANIYGHLAFGDEEEYDVVNYGGNNAPTVDLTYARTYRQNNGETFL